MENKNFGMDKEGVLEMRRRMQKYYEYEEQQESELTGDEKLKQMDILCKFGKKTLSKEKIEEIQQEHLESLIHVQNLFRKVAEKMIEGDGQISSFKMK